jgi:hypothetical protein
MAAEHGQRSKSGMNEPHLPYRMTLCTIRNFGLQRHYAAEIYQDDSRWLFRLVCLLTKFGEMEADGTTFRNRFEKLLFT